MCAPCELFFFTNVLHSRGPWLLDVELRRQSDCNVCGVEALTAILQQAEFFKTNVDPSMKPWLRFFNRPKTKLVVSTCVCVCHQIYTFNIFIVSVHTLVFSLLICFCV